MIQEIKSFHGACSTHLLILKLDLKNKIWSSKNNDLRYIVQALQSCGVPSKNFSHEKRKFGLLIHNMVVLKRNPGNPLLSGLNAWFKCVALDYFTNYPVVLSGCMINHPIPLLGEFSSNFKCVCRHIEGEMSLALRLLVYWRNSLRLLIILCLEDDLHYTTHTCSTVRSEADV